MMLHLAPLQKPAKLSQHYKHGTKNIAIPGVTIVPVALSEALDGKTTADYVSAVEPSPEGGKKLAEFFVKTLFSDKSTKSSANNLIFVQQPTHRGSPGQVKDIANQIMAKDSSKTISDFEFTNLPTNISIANKTGSECTASTSLWGLGDLCFLYLKLTFPNTEGQCIDSLTVKYKINDKAESEKLPINYSVQAIP